MNEDRPRESRPIGRRNFSFNIASGLKEDFESLKGNFCDTGVSEVSNELWIPERCVEPQGLPVNNNYESLKENFSPLPSSQKYENQTFLLRTPIKSTIDVEQVNEIKHEDRIDTADPYEEQSCWVTLSNVPKNLFSKLKLYLCAQIGEIVLSVQCSSKSYVLRFLSPQQAFQCTRFSGANFEGILLNINRGFFPEDKKFLELSHILCRSHSCHSINQLKLPTTMVQWPSDTERLIKKVKWTISTWRPLSYLTDILY